LEGVSPTPHTLTAIQAALQACFLYFLAHNSHDALQAYPRPYANGAVDLGEDLVDPGVDLRITQLLEEGTD
jgi:hypothetical protein